MMACVLTSNLSANWVEPLRSLDYAARGQGTTLNTAPGRSANGGTGRAIGAGLCVAAALMHVEFLRALRSSIWVPFSASAWAAAVGVFLVYALAAAAVASLVLRLVRPFLRRKKTAATVLAGLAAAVAVWCALIYFRDDALSKTDALFGALAAVWLAETVLFTSLLGRSFTQAALLWCGALAVSVYAMYVSAEYAFLDLASRPRVVAVAGLSVLAVVLTAMTAAAVLARVLRSQWPLKLSALVLLLALVGARSYLENVQPRTEPAEGPNLLLVTADALRAKSCSIHGGPVDTASLETLASQGMQFDHAYSLAPWTVPSMFGMFSSSYPPSLTPGADREQWDLELASYLFPRDVPTLAEELRERGYVTGGFVGNLLLSDTEGILRGFDYTVAYDPHMPVPPQALSAVPLARRAIARLYPAAVPLRPLDCSRLLNAYASRFLRRHSHQPFFLWVHHIDPHDPYAPPARYRTGEDGPWPLFAPVSPRWGTPRKRDDGSIDVSDEHKPYVLSLYEGEIAYVDECLGEMLEVLESEGAASSTYVCFTSDHGEEFWEHGQYGHGQALYEELVHVPLVLCGPGIQPGHVTRAVSAIDLMPTLADLLEVEPPEQWHGLPLTGLLHGGTYAESSGCFMQSTNRYAWPETHHAVVHGSHKLIRKLPDGAHELYDLSSDPQEQTNIAANAPHEVDALSKHIQEWHQAFPAFLPVAEVDAGHQQEMLDKLEAMGYTDNP